MKHLLIILISILLLSSPVIGDNHKGETLYGWGEYPDYVWKGVGEKDTHPVYKGEVENGVPNGQGTFTFISGSKYVGEWKNGEPYGQGTETYRNGDKYVGEFKDGKINGQGTLTYLNGNKSVGKWKDDIFWNGTEYDKNENIKVKFVNGKEIKQ